MKLANLKGQLKSSIIIDELPTIYFRGTDNLIATTRSNKVAVCFGFQDFSQLARDYGDKEAKVIQNTVGNVSAGRSWEKPSRISRSVSVKSCNNSSRSPSPARNLDLNNTQMDSLIPASKITNPS